jgi:hypothetical protein
MKRKTLQKLTVLMILVLSAGFFIATPIVRADTANTTPSNLSSVLEQLIQLLTQQLQTLEQQLTNQQQQINTLQNTYSQPTQLATTTSLSSVADFIAEIQTSTVSIKPTDSSDSNFKVSFNVIIASSDGNPLASKHVNINGESYNSDNNGIIFMTISSYYGGPLRLIITEESTGVQSQTITFVPPPYTLSTWSNVRLLISDPISCPPKSSTPSGYWSPTPCPKGTAAGTTMGGYVCEPLDDGA